MLQKKKELQIMKIKIIFFDSRNDTASTRNGTATAIFEWPYHCEGGRVLARPYFLSFYEYSKDQKKTDLKITSTIVRLLGGTEKVKLFY